MSNKQVSGRETGLLLACLLGMGCAFAPECGGAAEPELTREGVEFFERRIRPVLVSKCYACHGPGKRDGELRLDTAEGLSRGGENGLVIIPGDPAKSRLIEVIRRGHGGRAMPPKMALPPSTVADFETWVQMGAPDPREAASPKPGDPRSPHWAFQPLLTPSAPQVADAAWVKDPIDAFVLGALEQHGLRPAPGPDRAVLIRRLSFDLLGLPPTVAEIDAFVADTSPLAMERLVDRLLQSPRFGEHWGGAWLRTVRYADIANAELSPVRENAWRYRDYVIAAFNADKPYDQFVREQLAGDLLAREGQSPSHEELIATGFLTVGARLAMEPKRSQLIWETVDEQVDLTTRSFLGLSVACARCHDHKSDPITTADYYALAGIFASTASLSSTADDARRAATQWLERSLATTEQLAAVSKYETRFEELKQQFREAREMQIAFPGDVDSASLAGVVVDNLAAEIHGAWKESSYSTNFVDRNYLHDGNADKGKKSARFLAELPNPGLYEVLISYTPRANRATNVPVTITSLQGAKTVYLDQTLAPTIDKAFASVGRFKFDIGKPASVLIATEGTKGFVVVDAVRFVPVEKEQAGGAPVAEAAEPEKALLNFRQIERELLEYRATKPFLPQAMAVQEGPIQDCRVRVGGDAEKQGARIARGFLSALPTPDSTLYAITDETSGRLELANWILSPENPLTARVAVNRVWSQLTARGLVEPADDFGCMGGAPTHPELLDHLARRFVAQGWSVKKLIRTIVLSSTYQMSSHADPSALAKDSQNLLLSRMHRRPLSVAALRDASIFLSREMEPCAGGTWLPTNNVPVEPLLAARRAQNGSLCRTVYLPVMRGRVADVLRAFDRLVAVAPKAGSPAARRGAAQQFLRDRARAWVDALQEAEPSDEVGRLSLAYRQAFGRLPRPEEAAEAMQRLAAAKVMAKSEVEPVASAWASYCQALLMSDAFRFLE